MFFKYKIIIENLETKKAFLIVFLFIINLTFLYKIDYIVIIISLYRIQQKKKKKNSESNKWN